MRTTTQEFQLSAESTARARNLVSVIVPTTQQEQRTPAQQALRKLEKETPTESNADAFLPSHTCSVSFQHENWASINRKWERWHAALLADTKCTPTTQQHEVIQCIHLRTKYEHFVEQNMTMEEDIKDFSPKPMFHLLHGLPGAGKSQVLQWLQSYWQTVWQFESGIHFAFVAYSNSMADNINGFTMHSFFNLPWKTADGTVVNTSDEKSWTKLLTRMSLLKFVVIDEVEAAGMHMLNSVNERLQEISSRAICYRKVTCGNLPEGSE